ncbi:MAG: 3-deoxy-7-phosphoheptulonate synthase, partial [Clostridia bacterium]|nr:3-deoxy-7-phosphoheptulonate synthase [Clostridia bacterium]
MSFKYKQMLPTPKEIQEEYPLKSEYHILKQKRDQEIADVLTGKDDRFLVIIGPCSADNEDAVCEYVGRLARVNERVRDRLLIIPRIYTNKPRTTGDGYKGITSQPNPEEKPDFRAGLIAMRKMQIHAIEVSGLTAADEMLYPDNWG